MSITQSSTIVKTELYQPNSDRAAILELADDCLAQAQRFRADWLRGGKPAGAGAYERRQDHDR